MRAVLALVPWAVSAQAAAPSDAQIAGIVVTANQVDFDTRRLAESKASNKEVKSFAQRMVTDHAGVDKPASELVTKRGVEPEDSSVSAAQRPKSLDGAAFDPPTSINEVTYHQTVLDALDKTLIPSASNAEPKALLVKVRPAFVAHQAHPIDTGQVT